MPPDPLKSICTCTHQKHTNKRSTSKLEKESFSDSAPENDLRLLKFQKSPGGECPQTPLAIHVLVHIENTQTKGSQ